MGCSVTRARKESIKFFTITSTCHVSRTSDKFDNYSREVLMSNKHDNCVKTL